ncbi:MAG: metal-dependent phosphohydrolase [Treponema sp.]|jgi:HD-GYP domain-containing protein (c-di-GMP phosphodiesterase class II)|nr:metal-dependent phosphohydrolase [Treponema sp.]
MPGKEAKIPLSRIFSPQNDKYISKNYIDIIIDEDIPVLCINRESKRERLMPFKVLYDTNDNFWMQVGSWEYFFTDENFSIIKEKAASKPVDWNSKLSRADNYGNDDDLEELDVEVGYGKEYHNFSGMSTEQKIERLNKDKKRLNDLLLQKSRNEADIAKALVDTTKDAALINHTALEDAILLADHEAKKLTQELVNSTHEMVKSSAQLVAENVFNNDMVNTLVQKSNGTIVQHMTRVYLNGIAFLSFYNNLVSTSSAIQKLRVTFAAKYRKYYHKLLPHMRIEDIVLERVFYGGMRAIPPELYFKWAVGFLIHDIGKAAAVEYHEGEGSYDRTIVIDHVKQGFKSIMTKTNYPMEASLITGYHHEYYGNPDGYGYFRAYLQQYKKQNPDAKVDYCISYDLEPIMDYNALAYFPAKVLEIIDVYDSVTDPHRAYRKAMSPEEALVMMRKEFIEKDYKIDAVLFDIFSRFIREQEKQKNT